MANWRTAVGCEKRESLEFTLLEEGLSGPLQTQCDTVLVLMIVGTQEINQSRQFRNASR